QTQTVRGTELLTPLRLWFDKAPKQDISPEYAHRFESALHEVEQKLDGDRVLANEIQAAGNVLLSIPYRLQSLGAAADLRTLPEPLLRFTVPLSAQSETNVLDNFFSTFTRGSVPPTTSFRVPASTLSSAAFALGHFQPQVDFDGKVRFENLVVAHQGQNFPSLSLALAAAGMGVNLKEARVLLGRGVMLGTELLDTDKTQRLMPYFYKRKGDKGAFKTISFQNVYNQHAANELFRDQVVIIGLTHPDWIEPVAIPTGEMVAPVVVLANTVTSILNGDYYRVPEWAPWIEILAILLVALYLVSLLPRIRVGMGLALTAIFVVMFGNLYVIVMAAQGIWLQLITPIAQLLVGHTILGIKRGYGELAARSRSENAEANRMLALAYQSQGQLDLAFEKLRKCPLDDALLELLYSLGQDYERKRQFSRAAVVFRHISSHKPEFRDVVRRIMSNNEAAGTQIQSTPGASMHNTLVLKNNGVQKPMLGRYEIEKELGRGAMGMVYLGRDPKIGRTVAVKTVALSQEFDAEQLVEVKERFFREASTAGRLNHPNIVTIYDVGEEHDLAYIAMDYLEGVNLSPYTRSDNLLPLAEIFLIVSKVADALDYAHEHQVVHRDIKPANVVYNAAKRQVTVTDFGVAFLVDANKTKTGTILGTPSYMSPEQLAGQKVDGRSDLFALGVMFFQMVTGELPFIGESIATLLYKIANEKHPDPRMFRPDLPVCVGRVIDKALRKEIDQRFQSGRQLVMALKKCQEIIEKSKLRATA
ncbi:MAG: protein kinase, partial [Gammaproteobacteria bacterium]|nr:protein kinase [Gammaproteobacteria bacterium]